MAVFRINKNENYTVMANYHLKEKEMSLKAKGLLSLMLSLPSEWDYSVMGLTALSKDGKDSVMTTLNELEQLGYLIRTKCINNKGQFDGYDYDIFEQPCTEQPYSVFPHTANPTQLNTNESSTNKRKKIKKEKSVESTNATGIAILSWFDKVYDIYPRKVNKIQARKTFADKLSCLEKTVAHKKAVGIYKLLVKQILVWKNENGGNGRAMEHIPHFSTWLNANVESGKETKKRLGVKEDERV